MPTKNIFFLSLIIAIGFNVSGIPVEKIEKNRPSGYRNDTAHILALIDSGFNLANTNTNLSAFYSLRALQLSDKINYQRGIGSARFTLGNLELVRGNYEKALVQFTMSAKIFRELNDTKKTPRILNALACVYLRQYKYTEALKNLFQALNMEERNKNFEAAAGNLLNIGATFLRMEDFERAKYYFRQALLVLIQLKNYSRINMALSNIGGVFLGQGCSDSALFYYKKAINYFEKTKSNRFAQVHILVEMSILYQAKKEFEKSFESLNKALAICKTMEMRENYVKCLTEMARTYLATGQNDKAIHYANEALSITKKEKLLQLSAMNYLVLYTIYKKQNRTKLALQNLEELNIVKDSLQKTNNLELLEKMDSKYLTEKLQRKELFLKQQSDLYKTRQIQFYLILSLVFLFLVFISIMFFVKQQAAHRKTKILEQETEINKQKAIIHQQETALYEAELNKQKNEILAISTLQGKTNEALLQIINELRQMAFQEIKNKAVSDSLYHLAGNIEKLSLSDSWSDFRKWFTDIHPRFYENMNKICPSLTSNDLKLASLLRMNLSSKEIATLTFRSLDSIHIARYRLRKKLGIEDDNHLVNFLFSVPS
jgi:tetratricopeptide (TPR) repeat protein